jgi:hypothetical protein
MLLAYRRTESPQEEKAGVKIYQQEKARHEEKRGLEVSVHDSWIEFFYSERIQQGLYGNLSAIQTENVHAKKAGRLFHTGLLRATTRSIRKL